MSSTKYFWRANNTLKIHGCTAEWKKIGSVAGIPVGVAEVKDQASIRAIEAFASIRGGIRKISKEWYEASLASGPSACNIPDDDASNSDRSNIPQEVQREQIKPAPIALSFPRGQSSYSPVSSSIPVTVLIKSKNDSPDYIRECVDSIASQTHKNLQVLFADSSTKSDSLKALNDACSREDVSVKILRCEGMNVSQALNKGLEACKTELVALMDADDIMLPDRIEKQVRAFTIDSRIEALGGAVKTFGNAICEKSHPTNVGMAYALSGGWCLNNPTAMVRRSSVLSIGGYNESYSGAEDYNLWLRMVSAGMRVNNLQDVLTKYRIHRGQKSELDSPFIKNEISRARNEYGRSRVKVAYIGGVIGNGGAEHWLFDVIRSTSSVCDWTVCAEGYIEKDTIDELCGIASIAVGVDACMEAVRSADISIFWWIAQAPFNRYAEVCKGEIWSAMHASFEDGFIKYHRNTDYSKVSKAIAVSLAARRALVGIGCDESKISVVYPGLSDTYKNPAITRKQWRELNGISNDAKLIAYTGRLTYDKGAAHVFEWARTNPDPNRIIYMAGYPSGLDVYSVKAEFCGSILTPGNVSCVSELMHSCDCLLMPTRFESFCYSMIEAWIAGTPLVSTRVGIAIEHQSWIHEIQFSHDGINDAVNSALRANKKRYSTIQNACASKFDWWKARSRWIDIFTK